MSPSRQDLTDLIDGTLPWPQLKHIVSSPKDDDRFQRLRDILQARVPWTETILLPLTEHLYVVAKDGQRIVKCDCGHEFGDWRRNWKLSALILGRDDENSLQEIYPGVRRPDPALCEVREYICPSCAALLKVEAVPVGYPMIFDALPDIDGFYRDWLHAPLPEQLECVDRSLEVIREWAKGRESGTRVHEPGQEPESAVSPPTPDLHQGGVR
ncbi:MAG: acetone carboxylase subunit gamma [Candidatus Binatia bacterium]